MARCKLTNMNLRNIRKTREYQCLVIDLVNTGVMTKSSAEGLLGYTIPAGLLASGSSTPIEDGGETGGDNPGTGGETGGETGSVTLAVNLGDMDSQLSGGNTPKGGNRAVKAMPSDTSSAESDGWLLVNFPLPEDPEDRWLLHADRMTIYNTELLEDMYMAIRSAVVATGEFTAENFEDYFPPFNAADPSTLPFLVVTNEDYQIGEDTWNDRFTPDSANLDTLADGMIFSYTAPNIPGGGLEYDEPSISPTN